MQVRFGTFSFDRHLKPEDQRRMPLIQAGIQGYSLFDTFARKKAHFSISPSRNPGYVDLHVEKDNRRLEQYPFSFRPDEGHTAISRIHGHLSGIWQRHFKDI